MERKKKFLFQKTKCRLNSPTNETDTSGNRLNLIEFPASVSHPILSFYHFLPFPLLQQHRLLDGLSKVLERVPILRRLATCAALRGTRGRPHHLAAPAVAESRGRRSADSVGPAAAADGVSVSGRRQGRGAAEPVR